MPGGRSTARWNRVPPSARPFRRLVAPSAPAAGRAPFRYACVSACETIVNYPWPWRRLPAKTLARHKSSLVSKFFCKYYIYALKASNPTIYCGWRGSTKIYLAGSSRAEIPVGRSWDAAGQTAGRNGSVRRFGAWSPPSSSATGARRSSTRARSPRRWKRRSRRPAPCRTAPLPTRWPPRVVQKLEDGAIEGIAHGGGRAGHRGGDADRDGLSSRPRRPTSSTAPSAAAPATMNTPPDADLRGHHASKAASDSDIKRENANIDGDTAMGTMLQVRLRGRQAVLRDVRASSPKHAAGPPRGRHPHPRHGLLHADHHLLPDRPASSCSRAASPPATAMLREPNDIASLFRAGLHRHPVQPERPARRPEPSSTSTTAMAEGVREDLPQASTAQQPGPRRWSC